ncbi:MAG: hypothetical protein Q9163_002733 [Psora crenata]
MDAGIGRDGLRQVAHQKAESFYGGVTLNDIDGPNQTNVNGIHGLTPDSVGPEGFVGRDVLLNSELWRSTNGVTYDPYGGQYITLDHLKAVAEVQGTRIGFGDILFIRSGYIAAYNKLSDQQRLERADIDTPSLSGVERTEGLLEWIWENFSAVAGDMSAFGRFPETERDWHFHEVLLAGWEC